MLLCVPGTLQYSASMASKYLASMILGSRLYLRQRQREAVSPWLCQAAFSSLSQGPQVSLSLTFTQLRGDTKWGTAKPTNPASKQSVYRSSSAKALLEGASSFQLERKENILIPMGGKSLSLSSVTTKSSLRVTKIQR